MSQLVVIMKTDRINEMTKIMTTLKRSVIITILIKTNKKHIISCEYVEEYDDDECEQENYEEGNGEYDGI